MNTNSTAMRRWVSAVPLAALASGCLWHSVETQPIEIKPIHITMDINLKVQRELDEFFDFEKPAAADAGAVTGPPGKEQP